MMKRILVVDDEFGPRESLKAVFSIDYEVVTAESAAAAGRVLAEKRIDLVLLDVIMPDQDGLTFLTELRTQQPDIPVIMISAASSVKPVVEAMRQGAYDYVTKPFDVEDITRVVKRALESTTLHKRIETLQDEVSRTFPVAGIVGESKAFRQALAEIEMAAETNATVLIQGESGTGKELAARLLHAMSGRCEEPFVAVHCGALPESLMESEIFGHEKGAFTNANKMKPGRFDLAADGTLFLDELGEMTLATQVKLLRVLQEREFMRVGGTRVIHTNVRIVAATARDLRHEVDEGRFRDDLFYRISVVPVCLPPLRERTADVPLLARHFLDLYAKQLDAHTTDFSPEAMDLMCRYRWPGNVRELRNLVERMLVLHGKKTTIRPEHLPREVQNDSVPRKPAIALGDGQNLQELVNAYERELIEDALSQTGGVQTRAAEHLGTTRRILRYRMEKLSISVDGS